MLKGQGADLVKEKLLATAADRFLVLVDRSKLVEHIGQLFAIPIEIIPFAWPLTQKSLEKLGGTGNLRKNAAGDGFAISSHGSLIADIRFDRNMDISELDAKLKQMPGVVEHGIFQGLASSVFVGADGQLKELGAGGL